ncbi:MAG: hypothetical protein AAB525_04530, partial [Patescibacteria group bacterium]
QEAAQEEIIVEQPAMPAQRAEAEQTEKMPEPLKEVFSFKEIYKPNGLERIYQKINKLKTVKELDQKSFTEQVKQFLIDSLVPNRRAAFTELEKSVANISNQDDQDNARRLVKTLPRTTTEFDKITNELPGRSQQAWLSFEKYYGAIIKELIFVAGLKQELNFEFANIQDYDLQETEELLELFRADESKIETAKEKQMEFKSFHLFKDRALKLLENKLAIYYPVFANNPEIRQKINNIKLNCKLTIKDLKYAEQDKKEVMASLMAKMKEYFNALMQKADDLAKAEFGEVKITSAAEMADFLRQPENTPYRESHNFQIKKFDPKETEKSILLPVAPADYSEDKLTVLSIKENLPDEKSLPNLPEPPDSKTSGHWLIKNPQFGYEIQDGWRRYGSPAGIKYSQAENGEIEIEKAYFHTAEEKEYFLEQLRGRPEDKDPEKREARKANRETYRKMIFDYLRGAEDETKNDEAQKEMRRLIKVFGRSRGWHKEHLAQACSKRLGIEPPLTGEEFMDGFIKRKGYVYYSEDIIRKKAGGLSLEGTILKKSLKDAQISEEQKTALALYFSRNNTLDAPPGSEKSIKQKWTDAVKDLDPDQLKEILTRFTDVRASLVDIGLVQKSFDAQGKVGYTMTNAEDVVLIPYKDSKGNYTAIRRRLLKDKLSYNYHDPIKQCWKEYTEEINGGLEPGGNKYLSDPRVYSDFEPRELEGAVYNAALLIPKIWESQEDWIAAGGLKEQWNPKEAKAIIAGQDIVITEGEFKSALAFELTGIPHIAIPGITMVEPEFIQQVAEAGPRSVTIVFDADPDGMAHLRGDLLTDAERAAFRIAMMLEAAGVPIKIAIWPEEYRKRLIKTGIKDTEDLSVKQIDGIEIYQNKILAGAVSVQDYVQEVNTKAGREDLRYTRIEKLNPTMEQALAQEHDLRIALGKFITAKKRGADQAPEELYNKINELNHIAALMWELKKETSHFYLGTDLDKPAEHVPSLSPDIVPNEKDKHLVTRDGELIPADRAGQNIINYRVLLKDMLTKDEELYFADPAVDEKQIIVPSAKAELNNALDFAIELNQLDKEDQDKCRQIRADVLNGLSAVKGLNWQKIIPQPDQYSWEQKSLEHDIDQADLLLAVYLRNFDQQAQRIINECFAGDEEKKQLTDIAKRLDNYLEEKLKQKEFAEKAAFYVIGNYLIDKFSSDDVRYELGMKIFESKPGALAKRCEIDIAGLDEKKKSLIMKFTGEIVTEESLDESRVEEHNLVNTLRGSYAEQRREYRLALKWCERYAENNPKPYLASDIINREDYLKKLVETAFGISNQKELDDVIDDLGLMILFPNDFEQMLNSTDENLKNLFSYEEEKPTKTGAAKNGLGMILHQDGKFSPKFMGPVLMMGKSPSFDPKGKKDPDAGAVILPLYNQELEQNPALFLERADKRPVFPVLGQ